MKKIVDKTIDPIRAMQAGNLTTAQAQQMFNGVMPVGDYKGVASIWDLDKAVKQPLALAEQLHVLGVLNGGTEDFDKQTVAVAVAVGAYTGTLVVPAGQVWYLTAIESILPPSAGVNVISGNWYCSLWPDPAETPSPLGQPFHATAFDFGAGGGTQFDEFSSPAVWWVITNKPYPIRLPGGTVLTFVATNVGVAALAAAVSAVFNLYGFIGKALVD